MSAASHPWTYVDPECGQPSFHRVAVPAGHETIHSYHHELLDGSQPAPSNAMSCGGCGRLFYLDDLPAMTIPKNWRRRESDTVPGGS